MRDTNIFKKTHVKIKLFNSLVKRIFSGSLRYTSAKTGKGTETVRGKSNLLGIHKKIRAYEKDLHYFKVISLENWRKVMD